MNVVVEVHFISNENKVMQRGSFPLRRQKPERVALDFWKQIKREMPFGAELSKLLIDGEDKTADHKGNGIGDWLNQSPMMLYIRGFT
jgi:hypothetical protein